MVIGQVEEDKKDVRGQKMSEVNFTNNSDKVREGFKDAIERGLWAIGATAETYAKRLCPVDTGRLRNSIAHEVEGQDAYIGTNVEYAPFIEYGTSRMKPRPYLRPAATGHGDEYRKIMEASMKAQ